MKIDLREWYHNAIFDELSVDDLSDLAFHFFYPENIVAEKQQFKIQ